MGKVVLNMKENYKYSTIKSCSLGRLSKQGAATRLNISVRHVNRLLLIYKLHGKDGFIHGNKHRSSSNKISDDVKLKIISLYKSKCFSSNT